MQWQNSSGTVLSKIAKDGSPLFLHYASSSGNPTWAAGTGAGTGGSVAVTGNDFDGTITVITGTSSAGSAATIITATFATSYTVGANPVCVFSPTSATAALLSGATHPYITATVSGFILHSGLLALTDSTGYSWSYHCAN
jgi:hypothetical protein